METFSRPPSRGTSDCADPEASWGHRSGGGPGQDSELFFGYYPSAATMMREEHGPPVPELARRMTACSCRHDPARALVPVLTAMPGGGIPLGDILADSGYAHRDADAWALPLRQSGAELVQDLHPSDRGPRGTHHGAIIANGNLYCPATPRTLLELAPLARDATPDQAAAHDQQTAETARYKLGKITTDDTDGYHRVMCPAVMWSPRTLVDRFPLCRIYIRNVNRSLKTHQGSFSPGGAVSGRGCNSARCSRIPRTVPLRHPATDAGG